MFEIYKSYKPIENYAVLTLYDVQGFRGESYRKLNALRRGKQKDNEDLIFLVLDEYIQDFGPGDLYWYKILFDARMYVICLGPNEIEDFDQLYEQVYMDGEINQNHELEKTLNSYDNS